MMINSGIYSLETLRWTGPKMLSMPILCLYVYSDLFLFVICYCFIQVFSWSTLSRRESWPQCPPTMGAKTGVQHKNFFLDFFKYVPTFLCFHCFSLHFAISLLCWLGTHYFGNLQHFILHSCKNCGIFLISSNTILQIFFKYWTEFFKIFT